MFRNPELVPWAGDGVDVPFETPRGDLYCRRRTGRPDNSLVVAECKRWVSAVKQEDVWAFAHKVERLREVLGVPVAGVFIAKTSHQAGAIRVGEFEGIEIAVLDQGSARRASASRSYATTSRETRLRRITMHVPPIAIRLTGHDAALSHRNSAGEIIGTDQASSTD